MIVNIDPKGAIVVLRDADLRRMTYSEGTGPITLPSGRFNIFKDIDSPCYENIFINRYFRDRLT